MAFSDDETEAISEVIDYEFPPGDRMCAICDDGGIVLFCEGKCMRSFHAKAIDGENTRCESLGLSYAELQALMNTAFSCKNCKYQKHQCFVCGELGSSDESTPEVFCCSDGDCGYFYHPQCVGDILHPGNTAAAKKLKQRIAAGEQFECPAHRCHACNEVEVTANFELQFAVCRRCPLPREITCEEDQDLERGIAARAWE